MVAVDVWGHCSEGIIVLVLPAAGDGLALIIPAIRDEAVQLLTVAGNIQVPVDYNEISVV